MKSGLLPTEKKKLLPLAAGGLAAGVLNGLIGTGGGIVIALTLTVFLPREDYSAQDVLSSAMAAMLPISLFSLFSYGALPGYADTLSVLVPSALGGALGAVLGRKTRPVVLMRIFSCLVIFSGIRMVR